MSNNRSIAFKIVLWPLIIVGSLASLTGLFFGYTKGASVALGGLVYIMPNVAFVWRLFARKTLQAAIKFLLTLFAGEFLKLIISGILFVLVVKYFPVKTVEVLIGYITAIVAFWVTAIFCIEVKP